MRALRDRRLTELELLYRERFPHFLQVALVILGDRERALEAVQDGFAGAIRGRGGFRGDGPLEAWVWRAVVNAARKQQRRPPAEPLELEQSTNGYEQEFDSGGLWQAIALLQERQRLAVFLRTTPTSTTARSPRRSRSRSARSPPCSPPRTRPCAGC
jgi:DNA-directed RNA polymerase specialized sigma24 family protein